MKQGSTRVIRSIAPDAASVGPRSNRSSDAASTRPAPADIGGLTNSYCLHVWSAHVTQAISAAGGWLFDRAMAGWTVTIVAPDATAALHAPALRILGVTATTQDQLPHAHTFGPFGIAVLADLYLEDPDMRVLINQGCVRAAERWIVGDIRTPTAVTTTHLIPAPHQLSLAARAFKRAALAAVDRDGDDVPSTEALHRAHQDPPGMVSHTPRDRCTNET